MPLIYAHWALRDLAAATSFLVLTGHADPDRYLRRLRQRIERQYEIRNPGIRGRGHGTREWLLSPLPYLAVITWEGIDARVHRILPTARIRRARRLREIAN